MTPYTFSKADCMLQKQPPANNATCGFVRSGAMGAAAAVPNIARNKIILFIEAASSSRVSSEGEGKKTDLPLHIQTQGMRAGCVQPDQLVHSAFPGLENSVFEIRRIAGLCAVHEHPDASPRRLGLHHEKYVLCIEAELQCSRGFRHDVLRGD